MVGIISDYLHKFAANLYFYDYQLWIYGIEFHKRRTGI